jgi:pSer/pThr/pTyr-binding forkhead associated (FHA) protein
MRCPQCYKERNRCPYCEESFPAGSQKDRMPRLFFAELIVQNTNTGEIVLIPLRKDEVIIGRAEKDSKTDKNPDIDLALLDPRGFISRQHLRIFKAGEQFFIEDLGSANLSFLAKRHRDIKLEPNEPYPLQHGDNLRFATLSAKFIYQSF